jgi:hypothetical protein
VVVDHCHLHALIPLPQHSAALRCLGSISLHHHIEVSLQCVRKEIPYKQV